MLLTLSADFSLKKNKVIFFFKLFEFDLIVENDVEFS